MDDLISRQTPIEARRYTFGNDEFNLEYAYHDCKLVFDGITDDDSFQKADTGLILYYANEIIYALQEVLEGKDTNVTTNVCISRQKAIDAANRADYTGLAVEDVKKVTDEVVKELKQLPPAQTTLCGYNIEHLELIARVLQKENLPPERVVEALTDIGRIVAIVKEEFEESLRKAVEQCTI